MTDVAGRLEPDVLADALRDVEGPGVESTLREGMPSVARLVRKLLASPVSARRLLNAVTAHAIERRSEKEVPAEFGPVATDSGTYDDPPLMLDPIGSPEFEAAIDLMVQFEEEPDPTSGDRVRVGAGMG
jgi:hypothetical protein